MIFKANINGYWSSTGACFVVLRKNCGHHPLFRLSLTTTTIPNTLVYWMVAFSPRLWCPLFTLPEIPQATSHIDNLAHAPFVFIFGVCMDSVQDFISFAESAQRNTEGVFFEFLAHAQTMVFFPPPSNWSLGMRLIGWRTSRDDCTLPVIHQSSNLLLDSNLTHILLHSNLTVF